MEGLYENSYIGIHMYILLYVSAGSYSVFAQDHLYEEIQKHAKQYEIAPQNAMIDKIWKATPGYNGRQVDMEASYNNMKKLKQFDQNILNSRKYHRVST